MIKRSLTDEAGSFDVTLFEAPTPRGIVLFSVGGGGDPQRHLPLLTALAAKGLTVIAPDFARLTSPHPTDEHLLLRARRLRLALDVVAPPGSAVVGVGHSIGATMLLALAGGQLWMREGRTLSIDRDDRLRKLALLAPAAGFFQAPGALNGVSTPMLVWAGTKDIITPPFQARLVEQALLGRVPVDLRVEDGAGHFSFMHLPPPHVEDPLANRDAFLAGLTADILTFALT